MKKLLLTLALCLWAPAAWAQCAGVFPNNTICGNASGSGAPPYAVPSSSFPFGLIANSTLTSGFTAGQFLYSDGSKLQTAPFGDYGATNANVFTAAMPFYFPSGDLCIINSEACFAGNSADFTLSSNAVSLIEFAGYVSTINIESGIKFTSNDFIVTGTKPTPTGSCTASSFAGGATAGTFSAGACSGGTFILTFVITATNGWACNAKDRTTPADAVNQTSTSTTSAAFTATTASSDVVQYSCVGY